MQEAYHPLEIPDPNVEPFTFSQRGDQGLAPEPVTVQIYSSTPWLLQKEPTGEEATLGPRQVVFDKEGTHIFRVCSACGVKVLVELSTLYFRNQETFFEGRPETCHGCGATFKLPQKKEEKANQPERPAPLTPEEKATIRKTVYQRMAPDDREPWRVVAEDYGGDWERYLRVMAGWHGISIGSSGDKEK